MVVGLLSVELHIGGARSLKEKRFVLRGLKDRLRGSFNVSVAEVEFQDLWQRAGLAVVAVAARARRSTGSWPPSPPRSSGSNPA